MSILFLGKKDDPLCEKAREFLQATNADVSLAMVKREPGKPLPPLPELCQTWRGKYIVSYLCPWVIPQWLLDRAEVAAINFHPGPPEYPGSGCTNFALYDDAKIYGVTCHHMSAKVDAGKIVAVRRFPVFPSDTVLTLTQRCYAYILPLFYDVMSKVALGEPLPSAPEESWKRDALRLKQLNELKKLTLAMSPEEIARRVRACTYPGWIGAYFEIDGKKYEVLPRAD